jgi:hypothetical protein
MDSSRKWYAILSLVLIFRYAAYEACQSAELNKAEQTHKPPNIFCFPLLSLIFNIEKLSLAKVASHEGPTCV